MIPSPATSQPPSIPTGTLATTFRVAGSTPTTCWSVKSSAHSFPSTSTPPVAYEPPIDTVSVIALVAGSIRDHVASV